MIKHISCLENRNLYENDTLSIANYCKKEISFPAKLMQRGYFFLDNMSNMHLVFSNWLEQHQII